VQIAAFTDRSDIAARSADSDADGLTDGEEASLGLTIDDPDTDGDGIADAIDPLPLTRYDGNAPKMARSAAFGILLQLLGPRAHPVLALGSRAADAPVAETLVGARDPNRAGQRSETEIDTYMIVADDPRLFAGVRTPFRLMIYSHADLAALNQAGVEIGPLKLNFLFSSHDARNHYVSWTAGRIGGQFFLRCGEAGECDVEGRGHSVSH
jgi:hypothetical protein